VAILNQGKIHDIGTPNHLKEKIHGDIILQIRTNSPKEIEENLIMAFKSVRAVDMDGDEYNISLRSRDHISDIIDIFGSKAVSVNTKEPTLEDVFIQTIK
jgi:ABC-2 type transport system ATP-binding protein